MWRQNKRILIGVSGGIAAYKSPILVRRLVERGCEVRVVMSAAAAEFVTPLTLQAVSGHPVHRDLLDAHAESGMGHIELARWAEQIIIAPATADCIARLVHGRAQDLLSAVVLASEAEVAIAPAMNQQMWQNAATQDNLKVLAKRGMQIIGPASGDQACGETGPGRMTEPVEIANQLVGESPPRLLDGIEVLITAGPTWEAMDPVRGVTNHSSGKMGYAMAQAACDFGAKVILVSGAVDLDAPNGVRRIDVVSARDMMDAVEAHVKTADLFIAVAAVADYRPAQVSQQKIKKGQGDTNANQKGERMTLELVRNPDILASVAAMKNPPFTLGFAAETENTLANARKKRSAKNVDVMAANHIADDAAQVVFGNDENAVTLIDDGGEIALAKADKYAIAVQIIEHIAPMLAAKK